MGAAASARKSQAAATANLAANSARTAALAATAFAAIRAKKVARDALKRARLMVSNNSSVVKVPLPHNAAAFDNFDTRNVIRCVEVLQQLLAEDMERVPAERLVKTHHTYAVADPDAGTTTEHRVSNPALECQELLVPLQALLEQGHRRIPQGNVRQRVTALILANYKTLLAQKLSFTQPLNVHEMTGVQPFLTNDHRRALLRVFAKINKSDSGFVDVTEMEKFVRKGCPGIGDSVFLPMLFDVVPTTRDGRLSAGEWLHMIDRWCTMTEAEVMRFAFFQLAAVGKGPGEFPRIVVSTLRERFYEFEEAALNFNNVNAPLYQELLRFAGRAKREALSAHSKRGLQYMDGIPTHDLISFKQFKEINLASRLITHHLFYLHRQLRKKVLGVKWWDNRREAIRQFRRKEAARLRAEEEAKYGPKIDSYSIDPQTTKQPPTGGAEEATDGAGVGSGDEGAQPKKMMPWEEDIAEEQRASSRETPGHDSEAPGAGAGIGVGAGAATVSGAAATPPPSSDGSAMDMFAGMSLVGSSNDLGSHNEVSKPGKSKKPKKKKLKKRHSSKRVGVANAGSEAGADASEHNAPANGGGIAGNGAVASGGYNIAAPGFAGMQMQPLPDDGVPTTVGTAMGGVPLYAADPRSSRGLGSSSRSLGSGRFTVPGAGQGQSARNMRAGALAPLPRKVKRSGVVLPSSQTLPGSEKKPRKKRGQSVRFDAASDVEASDGGYAIQGDAVGAAGGAYTIGAPAGAGLNLF